MLFSIFNSVRMKSAFPFCCSCMMIRALFPLSLSFCAFSLSLLPQPPPPPHIHTLSYTHTNTRTSYFCRNFPRRNHLAGAAGKKIWQMFMIHESILYSNVLGRSGLQNSAGVRRQSWERLFVLSAGKKKFTLKGTKHNFSAPITLGSFGKWFLITLGLFRTLYNRVLDGAMLLIGLFNYFIQPFAVLQPV